MNRENLHAHIDYELINQVGAAKTLLEILSTDALCLYRHCVVPV